MLKWIERPVSFSAFDMAGYTPAGPFGTMPSVLHQSILTKSLRGAAGRAAGGRRQAAWFQPTDRLGMLCS